MNKLLLAIIIISIIGIAGVLAYAFQPLKKTTYLIEGFDGTKTQGIGMSSNGEYVVGYSKNKGIPMPFLWSPDNEGMILLPMPSKFVTEGIAFDVSNDGRVVVGSGAFQYGTKAVVWIDNEPIVIAPEYDYSEARKVTDDGSKVFGHLTNYEGIQQIFMWELDKGIILLGNPSSSGINPVYVLDISEDGNIIMGVAGYALGNIETWVMYLEENNSRGG